MEEKIANYCQNIGMSENYKNKIEGMYTLLGNLYQKTIVDLFISDIRTETNERDYTDVWFFTNDGYSIETLNFVSNNKYEMAYIDLHYLGTEVQDYNLETATGTSRFLVHAKFKHQYINRMTATGNNCDYLLAIMRQYFLPGFILQR